MEPIGLWGVAMDYELQWCLGRGTETIADPFFEDVVNVLGALLPIVNNFVILAHGSHEGGNMYIQTYITDFKDEKLNQVRYLVETQYKPAINGTGEEFSQHDCYFTDKTAVIRLFGEYFSGKAIDVTGWTDVTEALKKAQKNKNDDDDIDDDDIDDDDIDDDEDDEDGDENL